ncbi:MAG: hypothetical protein EOO56_15555 [Hymenobacter sp.]|nr:MAG: hypothetical protein EOO56_15555 [Hymenobacter sp.]
MAKQVGTFLSDGAFQVVGRGWVIVGSVEGQVRAGNQLFFGNGTVLHVVGVNVANTLNNVPKFGLFISESFTIRQELIDRGLLDATARILA